MDRELLGKWASRQMAGAAAYGAADVMAAILKV